MAGRARRQPPAADEPLDVLTLHTPLGPARAYLHLPRDKSTVATLVLGHGAGRGSDTRDLLDLAAALPGVGIAVLRFDQPWVLAGRRVAPPPAVLDRGLLAALPQLPVTGALVLGGRSAGARVACRLGRVVGARGVLALAFPLHPPGHPERTRAGELRDAGVPLLVLQGERDAFGSPQEVGAAVREGEAHAENRRVEVVAVPGADHGLRPGLAPTLVEHVERWVMGRVER